MAVMGEEQEERTRKVEEEKRKGSSTLRNMTKEEGSLKYFYLTDQITEILPNVSQSPMTHE